MPHKTDREKRVIELMEHQLNAVSGSTLGGGWNRVKNVSNVSDSANL